MRDKMSKLMSKSKLAIILSKLEVFNDPKVRQEQYPTDSEVAASILWNAYLLGDIEGKVIVDLGCGTGILGIGALLLGAKRVFLIDMDYKVLEQAKNNILKVKSESSMYNNIDLKAELRLADVGGVKLKVDVVIENPPFGTKVKHSDRLFLEKALEIAPIVYSFHKSESKSFLEGFAAQKNAKITHIWNFRFPLKASFEFHRRQIHRINVSCFRFEK
ncbi:MAG: METTL5 family protein [Nanoarchaeota archaeon]